MRKKNGFTMIELLAIIVILAIIALIAIPVVLNIIDKVRVSSYVRSADNILDASRLYFKETQIDSTMSIEGNNYNKVMESISGRKPDSGEIYIKKSGEIALILEYQNYCYKKSYTDIGISEVKSEECNLDVELDENAPIITASNNNLTVCPNQSSLITSYFEVEQNGAASIKETICTSEQGGNLSNTNELSEGVHKITCTTTKVNGKSASASIDIKIGSNKVGEKEIGGIPVDIVDSCDGFYLDSDGVYRYKGSNPNNYIMLGEEEYRIMAIEEQGIKVIKSRSASSLKYGNSNVWDGSDAQLYLYNTYYSKLSNVQSHIVEDATWNIGAVTLKDKTSLGTVKRAEKASTWTGKIGLMTVSEYLQAQSPSSVYYSSCSSDVFSNTSCATNNWIVLGMPWTITPRATKTDELYIVRSNGKVNSYYVGNYLGLRPVVYLSSDITLSGSGTQGSGAFTISSVDSSN